MIGLDPTGPATSLQTLHDAVGRTIRVEEITFGRPRAAMAGSHTLDGSETTTTVRAAPRERIQLTTRVARERKEFRERAGSHAAGIT